MKRVVPVVLAALALSSCDAPSSSPSTASAPSAEALTAVQAQLSKRVAALHDFDVTGTIVAADGQNLGFRYAMQQPSFAAGELLSPAGQRTRAFVFDGKVLAVIDDATHTITRTDLSTNEEQMLLTLHQVFSPFVCEGWRPPLVRPTGTSAVVVGDTVELTVPINAGGVVESKVVLGTDGAFVSKRTTGEGGAVLTGTTVEASVVDEGTGLKFPTRWAQTEGATTATTTLSSWTVNRGIAADRFSTAVPPGFTERAP